MQPPMTDGRMWDERCPRHGWTSNVHIGKIEIPELPGLFDYLVSYGMVHRHLPALESHIWATKALRAVQEVDT